MPLPYQGSTQIKNGVLSQLSPTLVPNFYPSMSKPGNPGSNNSSVVTAKSPARYAAGDGNTADAAASIIATLTGTVATSDKITLTLTQAQLPGGAISASYTAVASDTLAIFAEELATALMAAIATAGLTGLITATAAEGVVTVNWNSPMGNAAVLSSVVNVGSETVTLSPVGGGLAGGAGPLFPMDNFEFSFQGSVMAFYYGVPRIIPSGPLLAALAAADAPIM